MTFVLRMLARELRSCWRRLLFFFVCVAIGVGAIVALRSVIQSVRTGLMSEARSIIASDVLISTNRPWTSEVLSALGQRLATDEVLDRMDAIETATMVRAEGGADAARMVELRGVQPEFPFYGRVVLQDGQTFSHDLLRGRGALVRPELLTQLGTKVGGRLIIGGQPFTIRGVIAQEPGRRVGAFSFGSRVLIDYDDLRATGLLAFGSRASYQILLRVREQAVEPMTRDIRRDFRDRFVQARSYRSTEDDIGEDLMRAENYLSLVGFVMVVLGGIGVWSVTRVFVKQKIRSVAILKCLGATASQILATYVAQVLLLGIAGSLLGVGIAAVAIAAIPASAAAAFGNVSYGLTLSAALQGLAVGLLVSLLFSLVPLLEVRRVKPLLLLRVAGYGERRRQPAKRSWRDSLVPAWVAAPIRSRSRPAARHGRARRAGRLAGGVAQVALVVCGGFAGIALVLHGAGALLVRAVRPLAAAPYFPLRHAVVSLRRPGNQTRVILLAVGLGSFFVLGVRALQSNLLEQFSVQLQRGGADMFLIDIQQDQVDGVRDVLPRRGHRRAAADPRPARARHRRARQRDESRELCRRARPRRPRTRVRDHLPRSPRAERDACSRGSSGPGSRRCPPMRRSSRSRSRRTSATARASVRAT